MDSIKLLNLLADDPRATISDLADILGESRISGLSHTLNKEAKRSEGFSDLRSENYRRPPKTGEETLEQRLKLLENELAYTRQEVEFLKKIQAADTEARKEWESRHRQK